MGLRAAAPLRTGAPGGRARPARARRELYGREFLVERPLLRAIRAGAGAVLLIDELDRADDEFEAFLLEILSDFSVTVPELGTIAAADPPAVVVTSNRTRELHDALKRRCLYHWIEFPDLEREVEIIRLRAPEVSARLARSVAEAVARLRELDLVKPPGAAEAIDWARALALLGADEAAGAVALDTLGWAVKNRDDLRLVEAALAELLREQRASRSSSRSATRCGARVLRVGTGAIADFCRAAALVPRRDLYWAGRPTLVSRRDQLPVYDRVFRAYFGGGRCAAAPAAAAASRRRRRPPPAGKRRRARRDPDSRAREPRRAAAPGTARRVHPRGAGRDRRSRRRLRAAPPPPPVAQDARRAPPGRSTCRGRCAARSAPAESRSSGGPARDGRCRGRSCSCSTSRAR